jgi:hypothetical protein
MALAPGVDGWANYVAHTVHQKCTGTECTHIE